MGDLVSVTIGPIYEMGILLEGEEYEYWLIVAEARKGFRSITI